MHWVLPVVVAVVALSSGISDYKQAIKSNIIMTSFLEELKFETVTTAATAATTRTDDDVDPQQPEPT